MDALNVVATIIIALFSGAIGVVVSAYNERWKFKKEREALIEDRAAAKNDRTEELSRKFEEFQEGTIIIHTKLKRDCENVHKTIDTQSEAIKLLLLDKVLELGKNYINRGSITYDELKLFHEMHDCYHNGLGGNGDADFIVDAVDSLQIIT